MQDAERKLQDSSEEIHKLAQTYVSMQYLFLFFRMSYFSLAGKEKDQTNR